MLYLTHRRMDACVPGLATLISPCRFGTTAVRGWWRKLLSLVWRIGGTGPCARVRLQRTAEHFFQGTMGDVLPGQSVEYYFTAASRSGRQETLPRSAPEGYYSFTTTGP